MVPVDQQCLINSWHLGLTDHPLLASYPPGGMFPVRTTAEPSGGHAGPASLSSTSTRQLDVERRVSESHVVVKVHAVSDDGAESCSFDFDTGKKFSDFQSMIQSRLHMDDFICTYSTSPQFLAIRSVNPYRQQMLTSDLELSCAVLTSYEEGRNSRSLYVRAHQHLAGDLLSMNLGHRSRTSTSVCSPATNDWDFLEDSKDVQQLWSQLPPADRLPFARILQWHQHQPLSQVTRTVQDLAHRLPLQSFEWSQFLDGNGVLVKEADFRLRVYHGGISEDFRRTAWRHMLYVFPPHLTQDERVVFLNRQRQDYVALRDEWCNASEHSKTIRSLLSMIHNDVVRTDRMLDCFADENGPYLTSLYNILVTFALNDPAVSYVQGMNDIAGVLLRVFEGDEADTFIAFHSLMQCSKALFTPDGLSLKCAHLKALLQRYDAVFFDYLCKTRSEDLFFCYRWLLLDMKREFECSDAIRLLEVAWATLPPPPNYLSRLKSDSPSVNASTLVPQSESAAEPSKSEAQGNPSASAGEADPRIAITVMDIGTSPAAGSWAVIDCLADSAAECAASELPSGQQERLDELEEAGDATMRAPGAVPQPIAKTPGASSASGSEWDVVGSMEAQTVTSGKLSEACRQASALASTPLTVAPVCSEPMSVTPRKIPVSASAPDSASLLRSLSESASLAKEEVDVTYYGSPFTVFLCVAIMIEHRNTIMRNHVVEESIAMFFDRLRGRYDLNSVLDKARTLLESYVESELDCSESSLTDTGVLSSMHSGHP